MVSTSNATQSASLFKKIYREAPKNGFKKLFYGWNVRPGRDNAWYNARRNEYLDTSLFEKEYPASEEEALSPPRTLAAFPHELLNSMRDEIKEPIEVMQCGTASANIYQHAAPGKKYVAATDTAHGTGGDDAVTVVMDTQTGYVVADIVSPVLPPDQLAMASVVLLERYHDPLWAIEDNDWGALTLNTAQRMRYPKLYYRSDEKPGWHTDEYSRVRLWGGLMEALGSRLIVIPNSDGLAQFYSLILNPKKNSRVEAPLGAKDDYALALGIAWQVKHLSQPSGKRSERFTNPITELLDGQRRYTRW